MTTDNAQGWVATDHEFAARLALVRNRMGWNLKEAALACGLPPSSWMNWETKGKRPHNYVQVCQTIANRTGASFEWLALGPKETGLPPTMARKPRGSRQRPVHFRVPDLAFAATA